MNESITASILGDLTFSRLAYAYCQLGAFCSPIDALANAYGKITPAETDWGTVQLMVNYMKAEMIDLATAIEP